MAEARWATSWGQGYRMEPVFYGGVTTRHVGAQAKEGWLVEGLPGLKGVSLNRWGSICGSQAGCGNLDKMIQASTRKRWLGTKG